LEKRLIILIKGTKNIEILQNLSAASLAKVKTPLSKLKQLFRSFQQNKFLILMFFWCKIKEGIHLKKIERR
jgi:hypothetical protein